MLFQCNCSYAQAVKTEQNVLTTVESKTKSVQPTIESHVHTSTVQLVFVAESKPEADTELQGEKQSLMRRTLSKSHY